MTLYNQPMMLMQASRNNNRSLDILGIFEYFLLLCTKVCYMSFSAILLVHSYYTMTSYYTDLPFMASSSCSYCMDLPFMVDSIDLSAVCGQLQFFRSMQLSSLY